MFTGIFTFHFNSGNKLRHGPVAVFINKPVFVISSDWIPNFNKLFIRIFHVGYKRMKSNEQLNIKSGFVAIVADQKCGKSSFVNSILSGKSSCNYECT